MIEVAIASVEAVFDWKAYFKETFGYDVDENKALENADKDGVEESEQQDTE